MPQLPQGHVVVVQGYADREVGLQPGSPQGNGQLIGLGQCLPQPLVPAEDCMDLAGQENAVETPD